jgi:hypothetical protein
MISKSRRLRSASRRLEILLPLEQLMSALALTAAQKADITDSPSRAKRRRTEAMRGYANTNKKVVAQF